MDAEYSGVITNTMPPARARLYSESRAVAFGSTDRMIHDDACARRLWAHVNQSGGSEACWPWTASQSARTGYGQFHCHGSNRGAHRVALELSLGRSLLPDEVARHSCDNRACCNPAHLTPGSPAQNTHDAVDRGRLARGAAIGRSRLTEDRVLDIRHRHAAGEACVDLAREFDVTLTSISFVVRGITWKHVGGPLRGALSQGSKGSDPREAARQANVRYRARLRAARRTPAA